CRLRPGRGRFQATEKLQAGALRGTTAERGDGGVSARSKLVCAGRQRPGESRGAENGVASAAGLQAGRQRGAGNVSRQESSRGCRRYVCGAAQPLESPSRLFAGTARVLAELPKDGCRRHRFAVLLGESKLRTEADDAHGAGRDL